MASFSPTVDGFASVPIFYVPRLVTHRKREIFYSNVHSEPHFLDFEFKQSISVMGKWLVLIYSNTIITHFYTETHYISWSTLGHDLS